MRFEPGQRIAADDRRIYQLGACRARTCWGDVFSARKVFFNYRYHEREHYESAEDEWLEVQIRAVGNFDTISPGDVEPLKDQMRFEAADVLRRHSAWFPEPLDLFEYGPGGNSAAGGGALLLVTSSPRGRTLTDWAATYADLLTWKVAVCLEILELIESLHEAGCVLGAIGPEDFLIDENGLLFCMAGDRVVRAEQIGPLRSLFPPERYPLAHAAPEVRAAGSPFDSRADLYTWASLALCLTVPPIVASDSEAKPHAGQTDLAGFRASLSEVADRDPDALRGLSSRMERRSKEQLVADWMNVVAKCLSDDPDDRPRSVGRIRDKLGSSSKKGGLNSVLRKWLEA